MLKTDFVTLQRVGRVVVYTRTPLPYGSSDDVENDFKAVLGRIASFETKLGLAVDLRAVVGRNDAEFEAAHSRYRARLMHSFEYVAIVVTSHVGKLQVTRYAMQDSKPARVFDELPAALAWLERELARRNG
jgi:hypothetical protein